MRVMRLPFTLMITMVMFLALMLSPVALGQMKATRITAYVDGEKLLEHTFEESHYVPGRIMFVPYNGVVRFDDVKVTSPGGDVLFADDFEGDAVGAFPSRWERGNAGGWAIVVDNDNQVLEQTSNTLTGMSDLWPKVEEFVGGVEHTLEFRFQLVSWNGTTYRLNFIPLGRDRNNAYMIQYNLRDEVLTIAHRASGGDNRVEATPFQFEPNRWYNFRIEVSLVD